MSNQHQMYLLGGHWYTIYIIDILGQNKEKIPS